MSSLERIGPSPSSQNCIENLKNGIYGTTITLVALAVIFGALIVVAQHFDLNWGPLGQLMQDVLNYLGQYTFVPLVASSSLLAMLIVGGAIWKCSAPVKLEEPERDSPPTSKTLGRPYPVGKNEPQDNKPKKFERPTKVLTLNGQPLDQNGKPRPKKSILSVFDDSD